MVYYDTNQSILFGYNMYSSQGISKVLLNLW